MTIMFQVRLGNAYHALQAHLPREMHRRFPLRDELQLCWKGVLWCGHCHGMKGPIAEPEREAGKDDEPAAERKRARIGLE